ncbi:MAG: RluA family pseudouridine synthase [Clostridia bacterium]|nr:RluA family pseudouridine synthase [Clostridia bacterium]
MRILYHDASLAVAVKPPGLISERGEGGLPSLLAAELGLREDTVYPVHRLDRVTGGVIAYALNPAAAAALSAAIQAHQMKKTYLAVAMGAPEAETGEWRDLLFWDSRQRRAFVVKRPRRGVHEAVLTFERLAETDGLSLLKLEPLTGRTHQIRVQCASRGLPLWGDRPYGAKKGQSAALWCQRLAFPHPVTGEVMAFEAGPPVREEPWEMFRWSY